MQTERLLLRFGRKWKRGKPSSARVQRAVPVRDAGEMAAGLNATHRSVAQCQWREFRMSLARVSCEKKHRFRVGSYGVFSRFRNLKLRLNWSGRS